MVFYIRLCPGHQLKAHATCILKRVYLDLPSPKMGFGKLLNLKQTKPSHGCWILVTVSQHNLKSKNILKTTWNKYWSILLFSMIVINVCPKFCTLPTRSVASSSLEKLSFILHLTVYQTFKNSCSIKHPYQWILWCFT